jgi:hypothetical protein
VRQLPRSALDDASVLFDLPDRERSRVRDRHRANEFIHFPSVGGAAFDHHAFAALCSGPGSGIDSRAFLAGYTRGQVSEMWP